MTHTARSRIREGTRFLFGDASPSTWRYKIAGYSADTRGVYPPVPVATLAAWAARVRAAAASHLAAIAEHRARGALITVGATGDDHASLVAGVDDTVRRDGVVRREGDGGPDALRVCAALPRALGRSYLPDILREERSAHTPITRAEIVAREARDLAPRFRNLE